MLHSLPHYNCNDVLDVYNPLIFSPKPPPLPCPPPPPLSCGCWYYIQYINRSNISFSTFRSMNLSVICILEPKNSEYIMFNFGEYFCKRAQSHNGCLNALQISQYSFLEEIYGIWYANGVDVDTYGTPTLGPPINGPLGRLNAPIKCGNYNAWIPTIMHLVHHTCTRLGLVYSIP